MASRIAAVVLVSVLSAAQVAADTVYLRNGKTYQGKVTRCGDKVLIEVPYGIIEVPAKDVVHIATRPAADTQPAKTATAPAKKLTRHGQIALERITRPETMALLGMRNLAGTPPGTASYELRRHIQQWRMASQDRKRKAGPKWLSPEEFIRHRAIFDMHLGQARDLMRKARKIHGSTPKAKADKAHLEALATSKIRLASKRWADPLLRSFLMGLAEYRAKNYRGAEVAFRQCRRDAPRVGAFHQGYGLTLMELNRPIDAVEAFVQLLRLRPDSRDAVRLLRDAVDKMPGGQIHSELFLEAKKLLRRYDESPGRPRRAPARRVNWLMPGKSWTARDDTLPEVPYDRLVFRQAVAVPIAPTSILVDAEMLTDALEIFVRIDEKTLAPCKVPRRSYLASRDKKAPALAVIEVPEYVFTPLKADTDAKFSKGQPVAVFAVGMYEELGSAIRRGDGKIQSVGPDGRIKISASLAAGEAAGPVITDDARLVGFLAGKTDVLADGGGPDRLIHLAEMASIIKRAARRSYRRPGPDAATQPATGRAFVVHITAAERFD